MTIGALKSLNPTAKTMAFLNIQAHKAMAVVAVLDGTIRIRRQS